MSFIRMIRCTTHGEVFLSDIEYNTQMDNANSGWYCPKCLGPARFVAEYYKCHCNTLIENGEDVCPNCGFDHYEEYLRTSGQLNSSH